MRPGWEAGWPASIARHRDEPLPRFPGTMYRGVIEVYAVPDGYGDPTVHIRRGSFSVEGDEVSDLGFSAPSFPPLTEGEARSLVEALTELLGQP